MRRGFLPGIVVGAALALAVGFSIALVPTTPTWTLWRIKRALDRKDTGELQQLVDLRQATVRAVGELTSGSNPAGEAGGEIDYRGIASALLGGGKVYTVFNDPEHPVRLDAGDFLSAWWGMRREGGEAKVAVELDGRPVSLVLGRSDDGSWRVVGLTPLSALIRVKAPPVASGAQAKP